MKGDFKEGDKFFDKMIQGGKDFADQVKQINNGFMAVRGDEATQNMGGFNMMQHPVNAEGFSFLAENQGASLSRPSRISASDASVMTIGGITVNNTIHGVSDPIKAGEQINKGVEKAVKDGVNRDAYGAVR
jgi:hypothetical protein